MDSIPSLYRPIKATPSATFSATPEFSLAHLQSVPELHLRWATRSDIPAIASVLRPNLEAFEFFDHFSPQRRSRPAAFHAFVVGRVRLLFGKETFRFMVAERRALGVLGEERQIVGFATWEAIGGKNSLAEAWKAQSSGWAGWMERQLAELELRYNRDVMRNSVVDYVGFRAAWRLLNASHAGWQALETCLHLQYLMVDPAWQKGHGVGHSLLQWGLDVADKASLPVFLESSLAGYPFYLRHGFKVLKMVRIDIDPSKAYDMPLLVYEPKGKEGSVLP